MNRIFYFLMLLTMGYTACNAQDISARTHEIFLDLRKPNPNMVGLPLITWKSPLTENSTSPFPSFIVEAFVSSDVELKSVTLVYRNGNVVIGEKSHEVKGLKEKRIRQKLTLNDGQNLIEILVEDMDGNKASGSRSLTLGNYTFDQKESKTPRINVKRIELVNGKMNLYYELTDSVNTHTYTVNLFLSHDKFDSKQEKVSGDIGIEIGPGNHKITWSATEVLGSDFNGKVKLELRGKLFVPFVQLDVLRKSYKRGKDFSIAWKGDASATALDFDLYKEDQLVYPFANIANTGQATLRIPTSVKPGKGYYFKISNSSNKDQAIKSKPFNVKRRTPVLVKILPVALVGGAAAALGGGGGGGGNGSNSIPDPLAPTTIH